MPLIPNAYTPDTIAIGIISEGRREGVDDLAIVCAISCGLVESGLQMYANEGDPHTLDYPYQKLSRDQNSAGVYQQRYPWWDDPSTEDFGGSSDRMDVGRSTKMFLKSLLAQRGPNYHEDPGVAIANVQQPARQFRGRYAERMDEAWSIFNRLKDAPAAPDPGTLPVVTLPQRPDFVELERYGSGFNSRSRPPINIFWHTQEGSWDATAEDLAAFCDGSNGVSYHYTGRDRIVCDVVDTDYYSWSVLDANVFSINYCFAGSSVTQTREQWLDRYEDMIEIFAYLSVQDCHKYGISTEVISPPYGDARSGISDHKYVTEVLNIGDHVDLGDNFPWDVARRYVNKYAGLTPVEEDDMALITGPSWSMLRLTDDAMPAGTPMDYRIEGLAHEESVIARAKAGAAWEIHVLAAFEAGLLPASNQPGAKDLITHLLDNACPADAVAAAREAVRQ